jgi:hypothetical protein
MKTYIVKFRFKANRGSAVTVEVQARDSGQAQATLKASMATR